MTCQDGDPNNTAREGRLALAWSLSRKDRNQRAHAVNGNTMRAEVPSGVAFPAGPVQLTDEDVARVAVPADGRCLYYCTMAARNAREWLRTHDANGVARSRDRQQSDEQEAERVRRKFIEHLRAKGDVERAERLSKSGSEGYPDQYDVEHLAEFMGGQIILQEATTHVLFGEAPLICHIAVCFVRDGAGHASPHYELIQSWMPLESNTGGQSVAGAEEEDRKMRDIIAGAMSQESPAPPAGEGTPGADDVALPASRLEDATCDAVAASPMEKGTSAAAQPVRVRERGSAALEAPPGEDRLYFSLIACLLGWRCFLRWQKRHTRM